jgi:hypothetical protein
MNLIDQPVLVAYLASPLSRAVTREWFGLSCACTGMLIKFCYKFQSLVEKLGLVFTELLQIGLSFLLDIYKIATAMAIQENGTDSLDYFAMLRGWELCRSEN